MSAAGVSVIPVIFGRPDESSLAQLLRCSELAAAAVLCADHHLGYSMPIGGVVAYPDHVSPSGVGYDIACGNKAVRTNLSLSDLGADVPRLMDEIVSRISFGIGRVNDEPVDHEVLGEIRAAVYPWQRTLLGLAASQLGTIGAGNHYVDLMADEDETVWVSVHFGSRGFGHKTATHFKELAGRKDDSMDAPPILFAASSPIGESYLAAMELAGRYAYAGRDVVVEKVLGILGAEAVEEIHSHHNFAWRETHEGIGDVWVIRKGSTPARPGQAGFVGSSMGEPSVILEGVDSEASRAALYSTVHGAGRAMSRTAAAGKVRRRTILSCLARDCAGFLPVSERPPHVCPLCGGTRFGKHVSSERVSEGAIDWDETVAEIRSLGIELRGGAADEAPGAYKRLSAVLAAHEGTIRIRTWLMPIGVAMAGPGVSDPYKD